MNVKREDINIPLATAILGLLFCAVYMFKLGEAYFYDYPSYYIYLDFSEVVNIALKAILLYACYIVLVVALFTWEFARYGFQFATAFTGGYKCYLMMKLYLNGSESTLAYINIGMTGFLLVLFGLVLSCTFSQAQNEIKLRPRFITLAFIVFLSLNYFIGLNYHSFFPNSTWQKMDGKVLVGTYKDNFIFRECKAGRSYFYLEEMKDQKLEMFEINTSGVLTLRCIPLGYDK